ncbi:methyltransferase family protein [Roseiconus lacunae]|uniref:Isoprenylcysteine carboxylmethyltransferase family protein n=1 Tax=Roseiconus lacunae TaxID=2605694 RepID=A0ABT7PLP4_9BACT|nr:isoprenylcysteine carboxylmethyltransferase family protein [Roseiconus lacunae]MDM4017201.1 isoprenylcysteine carboxylmethyltransferase family protein [Roseiconus lacunae]WRQ51222.1 isoprenylcysteine carboxylmethyltransferase family protein [Stieleria sp. HD01]
MNAERKREFGDNHPIAIVLQFVFSAALVLTIQWTPFPWIAILAGTPGAVLAIAAWFQIGLRNIRVAPAVTPSTKLTTSGPYRIVRHPMYTGLLWFTAATLGAPLDQMRLLMWIGLLFVLNKKSLIEERSLRQHFDQYADYQNRVGRLFPKLTTWLR